MSTMPRETGSSLSLHAVNPAAITDVNAIARNLVIFIELYLFVIIFEATKLVKIVKSN